MRPNNASLASWVRSWPKAKKAKWLESLSPDEALALEYEWRFWARPEQLPPDGDWMTWLFMAGRGAGKTRAAVEWVHEKAETHPGARIAIVGRTAKDVREIMVEGESGIMARVRPWLMPKYQPGLARITWPNGTIGLLHSAQEPNSFRGFQQHFYWADEMAAWDYPESYTQLKLGLRLGQHPQGVVTTTPRPVKHMRDLLERATTAVTRGTTYDNLQNLAPTFRDQILSEYEHTRIGKQELLGQLLLDSPNSLWNRTMLDECRVTTHPPLRRILVTVDPAATSSAKSNNTGIVVVGIASSGLRYVLEDGTVHDKPHVWAARGAYLYHKHKAERLIAEINTGGDMVEAILRVVDPTVAFKGVHSSRGKQARAEPIAALYEKGMVKHVGTFEHLEDEMCTFDPLANRRGLSGDSDSPDRLDALVIGLTELGTGPRTPLGNLNFNVSPERSNPYRGM
jgi:phage terminase large subunit-like protein